MNLVVVSGGFDPPHEGHFDLWDEGKRLGQLLIVLNSRKFLLDKKGYNVLTDEARYRIASKWGETIFAIDDDMTVCRTLEYIAKSHPLHYIIFANGGDRKCIEDVPEFKVCQEHDIDMRFGVGGGKRNSSSWMVDGKLT